MEFIWERVLLKHEFRVYKIVKTKLNSSNSYLSTGRVKLPLFGIVSHSETIL